LGRFYNRFGEDRLEEVKAFLEYRGISEPGNLQTALHAALVNFQPMGELINITMREAQPLDTLAGKIFPEVFRRRKSHITIQHKKLFSSAHLSQNCLFSLINF